MKKDWTYKKLGEVAEIKAGFTPSSSELHEAGEYPYYKVSDMNTTGNEVFLISTLSYVKQSKKYFPKGSIAFPKNGAAIATNKKRILKYDSIVDLNTGVCIFDSDILPKFGYYWFQNIDFRNYTRGGALPTLDIKTISFKKIPVPPLSIQQLIVEELDAIHSIIENKKQQVAELDNLAQSLFYQMFGDPITNPMGWEMRAFEDCIEKVKYTSKIQSRDYKTRGTYPIISQEEELISGYWDNKEDVFVVSEPIVIFGDHTRVLKYIDFSFVLGADGVKILQPIRDINALFLFHFLKSYNIPNLGYSRHYKLLKEISLPLPPLSLQQSFAAKVSAIEAQKARIQESISETEKLLAQRMDTYFG